VIGKLQTELNDARSSNNNWFDSLVNNAGKIVNVAATAIGVIGAFF
jgi:hypothetical protein